ncbi:hypothetical protein ACFQRL_14205 [Microbacterium fluvii]|uniref:Uncharacterized protein n=1 Tax=Microbacterium fluvii TaxID=415215 RepID=A0ABW2HI36_9MICO|nr:hypothetical protein [Microbacterium fluvii]MCU4673742.1 hypothetical protein [Microbacterium fluvii]
MTTETPPPDGRLLDAPLTQDSPPGTYLAVTRSGATYLFEIRETAPPIVIRYPATGPLISDGEPLPGVNGFFFDHRTGLGEIRWWKPDPTTRHHPPGTLYGGTTRTTSRVILTLRAHQGTAAEVVTAHKDLVDQLKAARNLEPTAAFQNLMSELLNQPAEWEDSTAPATILVWCETCGREEATTPAKAHSDGWDFAGPGGLYPFGTVSPRTCPDCGIETTVWWRLTVDRIPDTDLAPHDMAVVKRIVAEIPARRTQEER